MTTLAANIVRLKCDYTSVDDLVDANTGKSPEAWRSLGLNVQFALYAGEDTIVDDLSNIDSITVVVKDKDTPDALAYISETLDGASLGACTDPHWEDGSDEHGTIAIAAADMDLPAATYWISVTALLDDGTTLLLGKGSLKIKTSGVGASGGSAYLTQAQGDARYLRRNIANGSFRTDANGQHIQLYNADTAKWHTIIAAGPAGAVTLALDQTGEE
jgi:hypothetical protein